MSETPAQLAARAEALAASGLYAYSSRKFGAALDLYAEALALVPQNTEWRRIVAIIFLEMGWKARALEEIAKAVAFEPENLTMRVAQGYIALQCGNGEIARHAFERAVAMSGRRADTLLCLAGLEGDLGNFDRVFDLCEEAKSGSAAADTSEDYDHVMGCALFRAGRIDESLPYMRSAVARGHAAAEYNLGLAELTVGNYKAGWNHHEARFRADPASVEIRRFGRPMWDGKPGNLRIHLHFEQGIGDTLQFVRFAPLVAAMGHEVRLEVQPSLAALCARSLPLEVKPTAIDYPGVYGVRDFEAHCPLMSLPDLLGVHSEAAIPNAPYLRADPEQAAEWDARLCSDGFPRIGLCWAGNPREGSSLWIRELDRRRSVKAEMFRFMLNRGMAYFFSLQVGPQAVEAYPLGIQDLSGQLTSFDDTAAVIANLDLVISVDTAVAHLAGAMGKPVWMLSRHDACWRWGMSRDKTPWYPTMKIYRQEAPGAWHGVFARMARDLEAFCARGRLAA